MDMLTVCVVTCYADDAKVEQEADQLLSAVSCLISNVDTRVSHYVDISG